MLLTDAIKQFIERRKVLSEETEKWYYQKLGKMIEWLETEKKVLKARDVKEDHIYDWRNYLLKRNITEHTVDGYMRAAKAFFRWLKTKKKIRVDPAKEVERPKVPDAAPKRISREEAEALLRGASGEGRVDDCRDYSVLIKRDYALVHLFLHSGIRAAEMCELKVRNINFRTNSAWVKGKGNKEREVCFTPESSQAIKAYLASRNSTSEWVWLQAKGKKLSQNGISQVLTRVCKRMGLGTVRPHRLRHTFAYESADRGIDSDLLRLQMGHADVKTTYNSYVRWGSSDRQRAFRESWLTEENNVVELKRVK